MGIHFIDAVYLFELTWRQGFVRVEAPDAFKETLTTKNFVEPRDTAAEPVRRIEESRVRIRHLVGELQNVGGDAIAIRERFQAFERFNGGLGPDRPMPEQTADEAALVALSVMLEGILRYEIDDDIIVVARI